MIYVSKYDSPSFGYESVIYVSNDYGWIKNKCLRRIEKENLYSGEWVYIENYSPEIIDVWEQIDDDQIFIVEDPEYLGLIDTDKKFAIDYTKHKQGKMFTVRRPKVMRKVI